MLKHLLPAAPKLARALAALLLLGLVAGCLPKNKDWVHPRIADPRKEDQQFEEDTAFCQGKVGTKASGDTGLDDCYRRLGWQRKE